MVFLQVRLVRAIDLDRLRYRVRLRVCGQSSIDTHSRSKPTVALELTLLMKYHDVHQRGTSEACGLSI